MEQTPPDEGYDLLEQRWIPVRWAAETLAAAGGTAAGAGGAAAEGGEELPAAVGLGELLERAHEIEALAVTVPPALAGLYRVLYAFTARVTGLDRPGDDWSDRRYDVLDDGRLDPDRVRAYLSRYADRFRLFDPVWPFLQDPRLAQQCEKAAGVNKLITTRPSGNNHAWFQHTRDAAPQAPSAAEAVLHLLVWRYWGPSGRCSSRTVGSVKAANVTAGPLRSALSYHPEGRTLLETLLAGVAEPDPDVRPEADLCPWEWEELPDPIQAPDVVRGPCSGLTARSQHALLLVPEPGGQAVRDAYISWAFLEKMPRDDDFLIWQTSKEGNRYPRAADAGRALWRDVDALLLEDPPGVARPRRPKVFRTAVEAYEELRVRAVGFDQDGQAKDIQFVSACTPPLVGLLKLEDVPAAREVGRLRVWGETAGFRLAAATRRAWALFTDASKAVECGWSQEAAARFWPRAEEEFWRRVRERDFEGAARGFRRIAEQVYEQVTYGAAGTARGARAREEARVELYGGRPKTVKKKAAAGGGGGEAR
ncbi:hypothetical protein GCM10009577_77130 [Streptomyces javensis]